jgi:hypothetical protein
MQATKGNHSANGKDESVDIRAYERLQGQLERDHLHEFALFFQGQFIGVFRDFASAAKAAIRLSETEACFIQQIGRPIGLDADTARHLSTR